MLEEIRFLLINQIDSENPLALFLSGQSELLGSDEDTAIPGDPLTRRCRVFSWRCSSVLRQKPISLNNFMTLEEMSGYFQIPPEKIYNYSSSGLPCMIIQAYTLSLSLAYQTNRLIVDDRMVVEALKAGLT